MLRGYTVRWLTVFILLFVLKVHATGATSTYTAVQDSIQVLRAQARYTEARVLAEELQTRMSQDPTAKPYELVDARQLLATMTMVAELSRRDQTAFAEGDSLGPVVILLYGQARYDEAAVLTKRQLEIYESLLGPDYLGAATSLNNLAVLYDPKASTRRPSRSTSARWRSGRRPSARIIPMWPRA